MVSESACALVGKWLGNTKHEGCGSEEEKSFLLPKLVLRLDLGL